MEPLDTYLARQDQAELAQLRYEEWLEGLDFVTCPCGAELTQDEIDQGQEVCRECR